MHLLSYLYSIPPYFGYNPSKTELSKLLLRALRNALDSPFLVGHEKSHQRAFRGRISKNETIRNNGYLTTSPSSFNLNLQSPRRLTSEQLQLAETASVLHVISIGGHAGQAGGGSGHNTVASAAPWIATNANNNEIITNNNVFILALHCETRVSCFRTEQWLCQCTCLMITSC